MQKKLPLTYFPPAQLARLLAELLLRFHQFVLHPYASNLLGNNERPLFFGQVLTRDSVTVSVDAVVYYRVSNATVSVANVENAHHSTRLLAQTTLRNILGTKSLHEILSDRESISGAMQSVLDEATTAWGIKVERVEM